MQIHKKTLYFKVFFILNSILDSTIDEETKKRLADNAVQNDFIEEGYFGKYK